MWRVWRKVDGLRGGLDVETETADLDMCWPRFGFTWVQSCLCRSVTWQHSASACCHWTGSGSVMSLSLRDSETNQSRTSRKPKETWKTVTEEELLLTVRQFLSREPHVTYPCCNIHGFQTQFETFISRVVVRLFDFKVAWIDFDILKWKNTVTDFFNSTKCLKLTFLHVQLKKMRKFRLVSIFVKWSNFNWKTNNGREGQS